MERHQARILHSHLSPDGDDQGARDLVELPARADRRQRSYFFSVVFFLWK